MPDYIFNNTAQAHNVSLTGTLGILITLVRDHDLPLEVANSMLSQMIKRRYRPPVNRLDDLI